MLPFLQIFITVIFSVVSNPSFWLLVKFSAVPVFGVNQSRWRCITSKISDSSVFWLFFSSRWLLDRSRTGILMSFCEDDMLPSSNLYCNILWLFLVLLSRNWWDSLRNRFFGAILWRRQAVYLSDSFTIRFFSCFYSYSLVTGQTRLGTGF